MPLKMSLFDDDEQSERKGSEIPRLHGQFIIDRDNIIIRVAPNYRDIPREGKESPELEIARTTRDGLNAAISYYLRKEGSPLKDLLFEEKELDLKDPGHPIDFHVSEHDRLDSHVHLKFKCEITQDIMKLSLKPSLMRLSVRFFQVNVGKI